MNLDTYLETSQWWQASSPSLHLEDKGTWEVISEDDGMGSPELSLGLYEGKLRDVLEYILTNHGDSFYGWGHQGRIEQVFIQRVPIL